MKELIPIASATLPALVAAAGERAGMRFLEFFAANIRNPHTRRVYVRAAAEFLVWCADADVPSGRAAGARRHLDRGRDARARGAERRATAGRDPSSVRSAGDRPSGAGQPGRVGAGTPARRDVGKTPVLGPSKARALLDSIDVSNHASLRDRAVIGLMVYSFARIGPGLGMTVEDVFTPNRRLWVRLREKGGTRHAMPCHHNLKECLTAYLDGGGLRSDPKGPLFRTIGRDTGQLARTVLAQAHAYAMIGQRAAAVGIKTRLGNHTFRATGITPYLKNGGTLKKLVAMANHAPHTHHAALPSPARRAQPR